MRAIHLGKPCLIIGAAGLIFCAWTRLNPAYPIQAQGAKPDLARANFYGVAECKQCHVPSFSKDHDLVLLAEYPTWKTRDRHALAYAVLEGPRGKQMADILRMDVTTAPMCLSCHATTFFPKRAGKGYSLKEGVSCDGCHGPAQHWIIDHALKKNDWRPMSPEDKEDLGMFNVRDPLKRAELCLSCHVGSAAEGKVVTHSMYAAGHPPLPSFELASFSQNLPRHWMDLKDVPFLKKADTKIQQPYHFDTAEFQHTRLVLAGSMVAMRQAMELLAARHDTEMKLTGKPAPASSWPPPWLVPQVKYDARTRWPELAIGEKFNLPAPENADLPRIAGERWPEFVMGQADCYACHHELKTPSWRQKRGYAGKPGRPQFQSWPLALAGLTLSPREEKEYSSLLGQLHKAFDAQPFGDPTAVSRAAQGMARFFRKQAGQPLKVDPQVARQCLQKLTTLSKDDYPDFDSARQIAWAFRAIFFDDWNKGHPKRNEVKKVLDELDKELNLSVHENPEANVRSQYAARRQALMAPRIDKTMDELANEKGFLETLQQINDQELRESLDRVSNYDPLIFKKRLEELAGLVSR